MPPGLMIDADAVSLKLACSTRRRVAVFGFSVQFRADDVAVEISLNCLELLLSSANEYGKIRKENYVVFTNEMSNEYYSLQTFPWRTSSRT